MKKYKDNSITIISMLMEYVNSTSKQSKNSNWNEVLMFVILTFTKVLALLLSLGGIVYILRNF